MCEISFVYALDGKLSESDVEQLLRMMHYGSGCNPDGWGIFSDSVSASKKPTEFDMTKEPKLAKRYAGSKWVIGHVRHATHGAHTVSNTHPIVYKDIVLVHNGIISNQMTIRQKFKIPREPEVDSFVIAWLLNHFKQSEGDWELAVKKVTSEIRGSYSVFFYDKHEKRLFYFRDTCGFNLRLIVTNDGRHFIVGNTSESSLSMAFSTTIYGFTINSAQTLSSLHPQESMLYEFSESGVMVLCELPSPQAEATTIIPCDYRFAREKDDICSESYAWRV